LERAHRRDGFAGMQAEHQAARSNASRDVERREDRAAELQAIKESLQHDDRGASSEAIERSSIRDRGRTR
jgi:hypothetical protein